MVGGQYADVVDDEQVAAQIRVTARAGDWPVTPRTMPSTPGRMSPGSIRMSHPEMDPGVISPS